MKKLFTVSASLAIFRVPARLRNTSSDRTRADRQWLKRLLRRILESSSLRCRHDETLPYADMPGERHRC